jgi:hypothetical protein
MECAPLAGPDTPLLTIYLRSVPLPFREPNHSWVGFESVEFANPCPIVVHEVCPRTCADFENGSLSKSDDSLANFSHPADQKGVDGGFNKLKKTREMFWSGRPDLNRGPPAPKAGALPGCATPRHELLYILKHFLTLLLISTTSLSPDCARMCCCSMAEHNAGVPCAAISLS